ncbi:uncharacterized protein N0V89_000303 [Didymosphaeria variabile]|uniref:BZIP domain-containing protein n=1 Tax=Didymosphaeria variabile TaxID=1932322 RepID=A0A9W9CFL5_9PLEO|nr:uncharacterized protein N0V89_000303 [Didymosphaeria variabile]KAJ4359747.1 hypothetical protein N0V89_000303 [Didymosphaeria variabile]
MPADRVERKKKTKTPKSLPEPGDPDRKRVLNVLAQRRYRERRKAKYAALEAQAQGVTTSAIASSSTPDVVTEIQHASAQDQSESTMSMPQTIPTVSGASADDNELIEEIIRDTMPQEEGFPLMDGFDQEFFDAQLLEDISTMLDIMNKVWDPLYVHVLPPVTPPGLPPNLHPTTAQMTIPHHPFLDALPWPSVREKLICIFSLPSFARPPIAQDDGEEGPTKAIMRLVTDLDDYRDGVRIHGNLVGWEASSELAEEAWEIGEVFYKNWWWCLDGKIIGITNKRRRERGLEPLITMY